MDLRVYLWLFSDFVPAILSLSISSLSLALRSRPRSELLGAANDCKFFFKSMAITLLKKLIHSTRTYDEGVGDADDADLSATFNLIINDFRNV